MRVCQYKVLGKVDKEHSSDTQLRSTKVEDDDHNYDEDSYSCSKCDSSPLLHKEKTYTCADCDADYTDGDNCCYNCGADLCEDCGQTVDNQIYCANCEAQCYCEICYEYNCHCLNNGCNTY